MPSVARSSVGYCSRVRHERCSHAISGVSVGNDYALLQELGGDCAGAITLLDVGVELPNEPRSRSLSEEQLDALLRELPQRPLAADPEEGTRLSLAGAQPKLPVIHDAGIALPLNVAAATTHIIKPEPSRFPGLVDNEAFCMELARAVDLPTASVTKQVSSSGLPYLLVERYDRDLTSDPIRRLHQEDVCQALGYPSDRKYQADGGPTVADTVTLLRLRSAMPSQDLPTFWHALVFNWLIDNCDAHAKNFSLLYDAGAPMLAPLYDLVSTTVYPELTRRLAMSLGGARRTDEVNADYGSRLPGKWITAPASPAWRPAQWSSASASRRRDLSPGRRTTTKQRGRFSRASARGPRIR